MLYGMYYEFNEMHFSGLREYREKSKRFREDFEYVNNVIEGEKLFEKDFKSVKG
jgi:hypothetical protein